MFRWSRIFLLVLASVELASFGFAQTPRASTPDLTGVWTTYRGAGGRGNAGGARGGQSELPLRPAAKAKVQEYQSLIAGTGETPGGYCLGTGMPGSMMGSGGYPMEIIQRPDQITIIYEAHNEIRRVYFENRIIPEKDRLAERNGYSTGRWEGDTLVVETKHFTPSDNGRVTMGIAFLVSPAATVTERIARVAADELSYAFTIDDPANYTQPWSGETNLVRKNENLLEYSCHEANYSLRFILQAGRARDHE